MIDFLLIHVKFTKSEKDQTHPCADKILEGESGWVSRCHQDKFRCGQVSILHSLKSENQSFFNNEIMSIFLNYLSNETNEV